MTHKFRFPYAVAEVNKRFGRAAAIRKALAWCQGNPPPGAVEAFVEQAAHIRYVQVQELIEARGE